ncbi:MAG: tyrosine-type recombinase/integrase [Flavobacteriaceae bacterium]|nr:tyrosine-type recombinase/integrase [Flavobacteriaceae bacterium]
MQKKIITLKAFQHRGSAQISIEFDYDAEVKHYIKTFEGVKWTQTHRKFYIPNTSTQLHKLFLFLNEKGYYVDYSTLRNPVKSVKKEPTSNKPDKVKLYKVLPAAHKRVMHAYIQFLKGKRLSTSTVQTYGYFVLRFLHFVKDNPRESWNNEKIRLFMELVVAKENYSISSHRQSVGALKHLTDLCGISGFDAAEIKRPKKSRYLPTVLSQEEVIDIIQSTKNLKHRAVIALIYSSGLRIGELINLELRDLDMDRSQVRVHNGKGRKDRTVVMAEIIKPLLYNYIKTYRPTRFFIEGRAGERYSDSSIRSFLKASCRAAGITKRVTPHTLRHSYATHMMEQGVDLRHIQELLGHAKPETTMIYTHVAKKDLLKIQSPLDALVESMPQNTKQGQKVLLSRNFK